MSFQEGEHGSGRLVFDLDYILEWLRKDTGRFQFRIAPATLTFREVTNLRISIDYPAMSAAMAPFSISVIERSFEEQERYTVQIWKMEINFPEGLISFESPGYHQILRGNSMLSDSQILTPSERDELSK